MMLEKDKTDLKLSVDDESSLYLCHPMKVTIYRNDLYDNPYYTGATLTLPATSDFIQDALDRARISLGDSYKLSELSWNDHYYEGNILKDIKIEEVNFLAWRLVQMDEHYGLMYEACLKTKETGLTIKDMINLTYTLDNCHVGYGIDNNEELGRFAADGDFIEELVNVPDEVWNYIDFEKVGKRMMESEKGIFINGCYVACDISDMQEIYDGITLPPCPTDTIGIFNLLIAKAPEGDESTESQGRWLYLPASNEQLSQLLQELDVQSYDECVCYRLSTTIPKVSDLFTGLNQLDILNTLAKCIRNQEQIICKAVLEFVECDTLEQAIEYCENLSCFDYYPNMIHPKDFGKYHCDLIATVSPDSEIYSHIDFESYGREQMACLHVKPTAYGFMSRNDQEPVFRHSKIMEQAITHLEM